MAQIDLQTFSREGTGKGPARRLRAEGRFPAVVYGNQRDPEMVALESHSFALQIQRGLSAASLINLKREGAEDQLVIIREIQRDPVDHSFRHADFYRVRLDQKLEFDIPVHGHGTSPGVKAGGIVEHVHRTITLRCLPTAVPHAIDVSLEPLDFGKPIHLSDITLPEGVEAIDDPGIVIFSVVMPRAVVAETAAAEGVEAVAAEPEVIGKGKKEDEEGAGEKPEKAEKGGGEKKEKK